MQGLIRGRVWKFGDNISTDLMMPGSITFGAESGQISPEKTVPYCMSANRPGWYKLVQSGDILVAGVNFGAGSSRPGYLPLQAAGIQAVVAESVSRLFYRNCINGGLLAISCPGITQLVEEGDYAEINPSIGKITKVGSDEGLPFPPLVDDSPPVQILKAGGLIPYMKEYLGLRSSQRA